MVAYLDAIRVGLTVVSSNNSSKGSEMAFNAADAVAKARARLAEMKAEQEAKVATAALAIRQQTHSSTSLIVPSLQLKGWTIDDSRDWNEQQLDAIHSAMTGKSFVIMGSAGTGKTTTTKGAVYSMVRNNILPYFQPWEATKWLAPGRPGIVLCSFTNMAVRQIAKHFTRDITCITIHKLLEFRPVFYEVEDPVTGLISKTMRMEPSRNRLNPLPRSLRTIVVDEASMVGTDLFNLLLDALPNPAAVQFIFIGDLNQLPPVYGQAILGRKLMELPIVELTTVYRQALLSPIISLAIKMKDGLPIPISEKQIIDGGEHGKVTIHPWSKPLKWDDALPLAANHMKAAMLNNLFDPITDIILCPFNVNFGVKELNSNLADWMGRQRDATVHEIIAGFNTHYYAEGDKVLVNKREAIITKIQRNRSYSGKRPVSAELYKIDRWGGAEKRSVKNTSASDIWEMETADTDVDALLASMIATDTKVEDRKAACSHRITIRFLNGTNPADWTDKDDAENCETFEEDWLETAAEVNDMLFAYAITVHKSQGSEWRKVFLILHSSHAQMCSRELLYTAITRAAKELYVICEPDRGMKAGTLTKAAKTPRLKGNTLAEKLVNLKEKFDKEAAEQQAKRAKTEEDDTDE